MQWTGISKLAEIELASQPRRHPRAHFATAAPLGLQTPPELLVGVELSYELLNTSLIRGQMVIGCHGVIPKR
jgi:hypothetical protein